MDINQSFTESSADEKSSDNESCDEQAGRFVRRIKTSSDEEIAEIYEASDDKQNSGVDEMQTLKKQYQSLLAKFKEQRTKKRNRRRIPKEISGKSLAEQIRGWQMMELNKIDDHKEQYHAWLAFKSTVEANWNMYGIDNDADKLISLQTKCKGFIVELINSIHRGKPTFREVWGGLQTQFFAPIDSGVETSLFYQLKQKVDENIFCFFERVAKQAYLCNFSENEYAKRIGETFSRNCLNPAFFLGIFEEFDDLDKLKHHARNFHAAMPKLKQEPVLAISNQQFSRTGEKRGIAAGFNDSYKRQRFQPREHADFQHDSACKFCGERNCNRRSCPARGRRCSYCNRMDHFEKVCFRKKSDSMKNSQMQMAVNAVAKEEDIKVNVNEMK